MDRVVETEFLDVPGFEEYYQFNMAGNVRSKPRFVNSPAFGGQRLIPARPVNVRLVKGYPSFIASVGNKRTTVYIHRIMAMKFIPNPDGRPHINHIDGDKANFSLENLEWCSHQENMRHAFNTGLAVARDIGPGERSPAAKLNDDAVREIKKRLLYGDTHQTLANAYGVSKGTIDFIARGETWGHVTL
jgi:hypothetical protein